MSLGSKTRSSRGVLEGSGKGKLRGVKGAGLEKLD
jgi:hypothetical protein